MYESFWQFDTKPFENTWDSKFYYPSEVHQGALLKLRYVVENRREAALLAAPAGLGKTLLLRRLSDQLSNEFSPVIHVVYPQMPHDQLLAYVASEFTGAAMSERILTIDQSVRCIEGFLADNVHAGKHAILVIDEAHTLRDFSSLEALRLLLNFEASSPRGLTLLLLGQPGILPVLDRMPGLEDKLSVKCLMRPFKIDETVSYTSHRITAAGCGQIMFDTLAFEAIHELTGGIPRRINRLCDLALLIAYAEERPMIGADHIESVSDELVTVHPE